MISNLVSYILTLIGAPANCQLMKFFVDGPTYVNAKSIQTKTFYSPTLSVDEKQ